MHDESIGRSVSRLEAYPGLRQEGVIFGLADLSGYACLRLQQGEDLRGQRRQLTKDLRVGERIIGLLFIIIAGPEKQIDLVIDRIFAVQEDRVILCAELDIALARNEIVDRKLRINEGQWQGETVGIVGGGISIIDTAHNAQPVAEIFQAKFL